MAQLRKKAASLLLALTLLSGCDALTYMATHPEQNRTYFRPESERFFWESNEHDGGETIFMRRGDGSW